MRRRAFLLTWGSAAFAQGEGSNWLLSLLHCHPCMQEASESCEYLANVLSEQQGRELPILFVRGMVAIPLVVKQLHNCLFQLFLLLQLQKATLALLLVLLSSGPHEEGLPQWKECLVHLVILIILMKALKTSLFLGKPSDRTCIPMAHPTAWKNSLAALKRRSKLTEVPGKVSSAMYCDLTGLEEIGCIVSLLFLSLFEDMSIAFLYFWHLPLQDWQHCLLVCAQQLFFPSIIQR